MAVKGKRQTKEHIEKRRQGILKTFLANPRKIRDIRKKILGKIKVCAGGCWVWGGAIFKESGYGQIRITTKKYHSKLRRAHIVSYETFVGEVPKNLELDHLCRNKLCINPEHLEPVSHYENMKRGMLGEMRNFN